MTIAAVGRATVDAVRNVTWTVARSAAGQCADETLSGTLTVNLDCTGSKAISFHENGQLLRTSVLSSETYNNDKNLRMVQKT